MWSTRLKYISQQEDYNLTKCRVCKKQTYKIKAVEKKTLWIFLVIPIQLGNTTFDICQSCHARVRVKAEY